MMEGVQSVALCRAECSSPENWRLVEIEFKGFMVPRFRLLPAAAHGKCTQGTIHWWVVLSPWDMVCLSKTVFPSAKLTSLVICGRWLIHQTLDMDQSQYTAYSGWPQLHYELSFLPQSLTVCSWGSKDRPAGTHLVIPLVTQWTWLERDPWNIAQ